MTSVSVYIVDDDEAVCDALSLLIQSKERAVYSFDSAESFLKSYQPGQSACLILDMKMPSMGGLELQQELSKRNIHIPIIFISGNADNLKLAKVTSAGKAAFLEKPFDYKKLLALIDEVIKKEL